MTKPCPCTATRATSDPRTPTSSSVASTWARLPDGTYRSWISEYDQWHRFDQAMQNRTKQEDAYQVIARQQRARGRSVERQRLPSGKIEVTIAAYR